MPKVTEAHLEARRQQILDAAWSCFARKGYHQATMQDICQESELSPGAIYRYFSGKEDILKAINDRSQALGREIVEQARSQMGGALDSLRIIGETMMAPFHDPEFETTARINIETFPEIIRNEELRKNVRQELTFWRTVVTELLDEAKQREELKPDVETEAMAVLAICAWAGLREYRLVDPEVFRPEVMFELMRAVVTDGSRIEVKKLAEEFAGRARSLGPPFGEPVKRRRPRKKKEARNVRLRAQ